MSDPLPPKPQHEAEIDLLRAQLGALSELAAMAQAAPPDQIAQGSRDEELSLLRQQLTDLAALFETGGTGNPPQALAAPSDDREQRLLKDLLAALVRDMEEAPQGGDAVAPLARPAALPAPAEAVAALERAVAQLLSELVAESDQRLRAEAEALRARSTLRQHGLDSRPLPNRVALPARRGVKP